MDLSKPQLISADYANFVVLFSDDGTLDYKMRWSGKILPINLYSTGEWDFISDTSSDSTQNIEEARVIFEFSFVWRGVWESRIYFKDTEYWGEELEEMKGAWDQIEKILKIKIKEDNPDYKYFDD